MLSGSQNSFGRVQLKVKKQVLLDNFNIIRKLAGNCNILTVLKANAYGTGDQPLSLIARQAGTDRIGVADMSEALHIRQSVGDDIPIQILGVVSPGELPEAVKTANMVLPVEGLAMAQAVSAEAVRQGKTVKIHAEDFLAKAICHEMDHLEGTLFYDNWVRKLTPEEEAELNQR